MKTKDKYLNLILPIVSVLSMLALWAVASALTGSEYILPSVGTTLVAVVELFGTAKFYLALLMTLLRSVIAFVVSFAIAFFLAYLAKKNTNAERVLRPIISIVRALPTIAVVLLLLYWTNSNVVPVIVTMLVVFPTTYTGIKNAMDVLDGELIEMCNVFGVSKKTVFFKVQLPGIMPSMLTVVGSGLSLNLKLMVAAEVLSSTVRSIGNLLNHASYNGEIATMIGLVLVVVVLGVVVEGIFNYLSKKAGAWR